MSKRIEYTYDCEFLEDGRTIDFRFPMFTSDIKQLHKAAGSPEMPKQPEGLHNALEDAKFNIVRYNYLKENYNV